MAGFSNITGDESIMYADNCSFDGTERGGKMTTNGQLWIGSTASPHVKVGNLTSTGGTVTITNGSGTINLESGSSVPITFTEDSGVAHPSSGNLYVYGLSGSKTFGSGSIVTIKSPPFSQVGSSGTSALNTGEFVTAAVTRTLPASAGLADGDLFVYVCTTAGALVIQSVGSQKIRLGNVITGAAGTATSTAIGDSITLRFNATDGFFYAVSVQGTWNLSP